jgi:hypothetical protein
MRVLSILVLVLGFATAAGAAIIDVPADQPTIQAGIDAAQAGDTVLVACGTYYEHDIVMKSGVWLRSRTGDPSCVTVDAQRLGRVVYCDHVDAEAGIEGFTITGGYLDGYWPDSRGAGIYLASSSPTIRACFMKGNEGQAGGGGCFVYDSRSVIENCVFSDGSAIDGGGIYIDDAAPTVRDCVFYDNEALFWGGAIFCENHAAPLIVGCTLVHNTAYEGAGLWCVNECRPRLENCSVAFNLHGDGVFAALDPGYDCIVTVSCSDAFGNVSANYGGTLEDPTGSDGNISSDPLFCDAASHDFRLAEGSPCLPTNNECGVLIGANGEGCPAAADVADEALDAGSLDGIALRPNPFHEDTEIRFRLAAASAVALRVFDSTGRQVREIQSGSPYPPGSHATTWDGRDDSGRRLAGGVYLLRLEFGGRTLERKIVLLSR